MEGFVRGASMQQNESFCLVVRPWSCGILLWSRYPSAIRGSAALVLMPRADNFKKVVL